MQRADESAPPTIWKNIHTEPELERVRCPACDVDRPSLVTSEWGLSVVRCGSCDLLYVSPRLRAPERNYWVAEDAKRRKYGAILRGEAPHPRDRNYREHLTVIRRVKPVGRLLDVGAHCGFFLRMARGMGWELMGVEPSASSAAIARAAYQLDVVCGRLEALRLETASFDIVTLIDVLEHVPAPRPLVQEIQRILAPGGVLFIKVPNARYTLLKHRLLRQTLRRTEFDIFDSREHVVHYTPETIRRLLQQNGFSRVEFYVPKPIQAGAAWQRAARSLLYLLACSRFTLRGTIGSAATDLGLVAWKA